MSFMVPLMLYGWPLVVVGLFSKYRLQVAIAAAIIGGYLLLPVRGGFDLPLLPKVDKLLIPSLSALVMCLIYVKAASGARPRTGPNLIPAAQQAGWLPRNRVILSLFVLLLGGGFMTALTNTDAQIFGVRYIRGLTIYDSFSMLLSVLVWILPYLLARKFLGDIKGQRALLLVFCVAGLGYSMLALFEIRMSPQLNRMFYGFFPHSWVQHIRGGGFRPIVFLEHGLWLGVFLSGALLAALSRVRSDTTSRGKFVLLSGWLFMTLVLSKTVGALLITLMLIPVILFFAPLLQIRIAACLCISILLFPMLRNADIIPTDRIVEFATTLTSPERASSLLYRFDNEDILLEKAAERPLFGWGGWGRSRVYNDTGGDISVTDGYWVILFGDGGWLRYISEFGLLTVPILMLAFTRHRRKVTMETAGLSVMLTANMIDLIPNGTITPLTFLIAGSLAGRLEHESAARLDSAEAAPDTLVQAGHSYRRAGLSPKRRDGVAAAATAAHTVQTDQKASPRYSRFAKGTQQQDATAPPRTGLRYRKSRGAEDE